MAQSTMKKPSTASRFSLWMLLMIIVLLVLAVLVGIGAYNTVRVMVRSWDMTDLPGLSIQQPTRTPAPGQENEVAPGDVPSVAPAGPMPEPWDGASRVTMLVMGLDYRDWENGEGPPRTDTMILLTIDPLSKTAGMLSIPRDLWVNIPGFQYDRINTAYRLGEVYQLPGGGPGLAAKTVESLLGVPIDYYAQIDFYAFERFIDEIGGVKIDVPETIRVDLLGDKPIKTLQPGVQTLPGDLALAYARARNSEGGDFDRAQRQQQVIFGIRDRLLNVEFLPVLLRKAPILYQELAGGIRTNLDLEKAIRLGLLAIEVKAADIKRGIIGTEHINFAQTADGDQVLKPLPERIRLLRDEIFTTEGPIGPSATGEDLLALAVPEAARIAVFNGTGIGGLASRTADYLRSQGLNVPEEALGDGAATIFSLVIDYTGNPYTMRYLVETMNIQPNNIRMNYKPDHPYDIELTVGNDWNNNNPMP
jgi:polyisoprenyl-teichoic acid--peptidoglycan teichoic acid transferase